MYVFYSQLCIDFCVIYMSALSHRRKLCGVLIAMLCLCDGEYICYVLDLAKACVSFMGFYVVYRTEMRHTQDERVLM